MTHRMCTVGGRRLLIIITTLALCLFASDAAQAQVPPPELTVDYYAAIREYDTNGLPVWTVAPGVPISQTVSPAEFSDSLMVNISPGTFGDYLNGAARTSFPDGLGAMSESLLPEGAGDPFRSTSTITASQLRNYTVTNDSGGDVSIDLDIFADGVLGYSLVGDNPGIPDFYNDHRLTASMELEVIVHRDNGSSESVWYGNVGLFNVNYSNLPLQTIGDINAGHVVEATVGAGRTATLNISETFANEFTVSDGEQFGVEYRLTAKSENYERYNWSASADLFNTATLGLVTQTFGATIFVDTLDPPTPGPADPSDAPSTRTYYYLDAGHQDMSDGPSSMTRFPDTNDADGFGFVIDTHEAQSTGEPDEAARGRTRTIVGLAERLESGWFPFERRSALAAGVGAEAIAESSTDTGAKLNGSHTLAVAEATSAFIVAPEFVGGDLPDAPIQDAPIDFDLTLHGRLTVTGLPDVVPALDDEPIAFASIVALARAFSTDDGWVTLFDGELLYDGQSLTRLGDFADSQWDAALANIVEFGNGGFIEIELPMSFIAPIQVDENDRMAIQLRFEAEAWVAEGFDGNYAASDFYDTFTAGFDAGEAPIVFLPADIELPMNPGAIPTPGAAVMGVMLLAGLAVRRRR